MKFELLNKIEQFQELKKNDAILVKWDENFVRHHDTKEIMFYNISENKSDQHEIICKLKNNHYFNYGRYIEKLSSALEVYKVTE